MIVTANPDIKLIHAKVRQAIAKAEGRAPEKPVENAEAAPTTPSPASPPTPRGTRRAIRRHVAVA